MDVPSALWRDATGDYCACLVVEPLMLVGCGPTPLQAFLGCWTLYHAWLVDRGLVSDASRPAHADCLEEKTPLS